MCVLCVPVCVSPCLGLCVPVSVWTRVSSVHGGGPEGLGETMPAGPMSCPGQPASRWVSRVSAELSILRSIRLPPSQSARSPEDPSGGPTMCAETGSQRDGVEAPESAARVQVNSLPDKGHRCRQEENSNQNCIFHSHICVQVGSLQTHWWGQLPYCLEASNPFRPP